MKKVIVIVALVFAAACQSPESRSESTQDSATDNNVTNSPPGSTTDTSAGARPDTSAKDTMHNGAGMQHDSMH